MGNYQVLQDFLSLPHHTPISLAHEAHHSSYFKDIRLRFCVAGGTHVFIREHGRSVAERLVGQENHVKPPGSHVPRASHSLTLGSVFSSVE